jgi:NADPH:quinone reductase-like Zn-dependent oxidoreductase
LFVFVVDYVTRVAYDSGTIQNCAWTFVFDSAGRRRQLAAGSRRSAWFWGAAEINPMLIFARRANLQGISVGSTQMFEAMNRAIAASGLEPVVDKVFSFEDAPATYRHLQSARHFRQGGDPHALTSAPPAGRLF